MIFDLFPIFIEVDAIILKDSLVGPQLSNMMRWFNHEAVLRVHSLLAPEAALRLLIFDLFLHVMEVAFEPEILELTGQFVPKLERFLRTHR